MRERCGRGAHSGPACPRPSTRKRSGPHARPGRGGSQLAPRRDVRGRSGERQNSKNPATCSWHLTCITSTRKAKVQSAHMPVRHPSYPNASQTNLLDPCFWPRWAARQRSAIATRQAHPAMRPPSTPNRPPPVAVLAPMPAAAGSSGAPADAGAEPDASDGASPDAEAGANSPEGGAPPPVATPQTFIAKRGKAIFWDQFNAEALDPSWKRVGATWSVTDGKLVGYSDGTEKDSEYRTICSPRSIDHPI